MRANKRTGRSPTLSTAPRPPARSWAPRLSVLIPLGEDLPHTDDELLGPPGPVAAGASWPVNQKAMLNSDLANLFPGVNNVAGGVSFQKLITDDPGHPRSFIRSEYSLGGVKPPLQSNIAAWPSQVDFELESTAPLSPGPGQYDLHLEALIHHSGQSGNVHSGMTETDVDFEVKLKQDVRYTIATDASRTAPAILTKAPPEPNAPPLPPGLSSAPIYRRRPKTCSKKSPRKLADNSAAPGPRPLLRLRAAVSNLPAPTKHQAPPPPLRTPDLKSLSPFSGAQGLPAVPADTHEIQLSRAVQHFTASASCSIRNPCAAGGSRA